MQTRRLSTAFFFFEMPLPLFLAEILVIVVFICAAPEADGYFQHQFQADKVVRLWFEYQDGIQVERMLSGMGKPEIHHVYRLVETHPFIQEVRDGRHGAWSLQLYYNLLRSFDDALQHD